MQVRELLSILLVFLLCSPSTAGAWTPQVTVTPKSGGPESRVAEQLLEMPKGQLVKVKMRNQEALRGRLGQVSQEGFKLQLAQGDKIVDRDITVNEVESVKKTSRSDVSDKGQKYTVPQQVVEIPTGMVVEVRLNDKSKSRGRIGQLSEDGFIINAAAGNQTEERKVAFANVTSIKAIEKDKPSTFIVVGVVVGLVVVLIVVMVASLRNS